MKKILLLAVLVLSTFIPAQAQAEQCVSKLITKKGRVIDQFYAYSKNTKRDACVEAKSQCRSELRRRQRYGNNYQAQCIVPGLPNRDVVTKTCMVDLVGSRGRLIKVIRGQATGQRRSGVKSRACQKAMRKCQDVKYRRNLPYARCYKR